MMLKRFIIPIICALFLIQPLAHSTQQDFMQTMQGLSTMLRHYADLYARAARAELLTFTKQSEALHMLNYASKIDTLLSSLAQGADNYIGLDYTTTKIFLLNMKKAVPSRLQSSDRKPFLDLIKKALSTLQKDFDL